MTDSFTPVLPGRGRAPVSHDNDTDLPSFELKVRPTEPSPSLPAFLPNGGSVPVPFDPTTRQKIWQSWSTPATDQLDSLKQVRVQSVYAPNGEIGDLGVHTACRLNLISESHRSPEDISVYHEQAVRDGLDGDPDRPIFSDWVTTDTEQTSACGYPRTVHSHRRPVIRLHEIPASVSRPVIECAWVVQSTAWGIVETCAYLTPDPDQGRARELAGELADSIMHQVTAYPEPTVDGLFEGVQTGTATTTDPPYDW